MVIDDYCRDQVKAGLLRSYKYSYERVYTVMFIVLEN